MDDLGITDKSGGADVSPAGLALPERLARLINPRVLSERATRVKARLADEALERVRRKRCAEIIAAHLLET
jgi:hypothetical protein